MASMQVNNTDALQVLANLERVFRPEADRNELLPTTAVEASRPPSFGGWIADEIVGEIIRGEIPSGAPIRELDLAARFQTSRTPVREAIRMLAAYGLLDAYSHRSNIVRELTEHELAYISEARLALEPPAGRLAAARMCEPVRSQLVALKDEVAEAASEDDRRRFFGLLTRVQYLKFSACGNGYLTTMYTSIAHNVARIWYLSVEDEEPLARKAERLLIQADAIIGGDPDVAAATVTTSIMHSWASLRRRFHDDPLPLPETIEALALQAGIEGVAQCVTEETHRHD